MLQPAKLDALLARQEAVEAELASQPDRDTYVKLSREFSELSPLVEKVRSYRAALTELADIQALLNDPATDAEMRNLAQSERPELEARIAESEKEIQLALLPKDAADERNVILEIRAAEGGDDAKLLVSEFVTAYVKAGSRRGL